MNKRVWIGKPSPKSLRKGNGWFREMNKVFVDKGQEYCVMSRPIKTREFGEGFHVCIRNKKGVDIPWIEKQKIKNELFGEDYTALEVFPTTENLIDEANMYHLWIFKNINLSFGLHLKG